MSLTRSFFSRALAAVGLAKETVGVDAAGNVYMRWYEMHNGQKIERREVKWHTSEPGAYDPNQIPSEWRMWLRKTRDKPPTEEEMTQSASKTAAYKERVAAVEEQERLRRIRQQAQGGQQGGSTPNLSSFLQAMREEGSAGEQGKPAKPS